MAFKCIARWRLLLAIVGAGITVALPLSAPGETRLQALPTAVEPTLAGEQLRAQAAHYRELAKRWSPPAEGGELRPGDHGPRVAQLRATLELYGDYRGLAGPVDRHRQQGKNRDIFDGGLQRAVEAFQRRHGLEATGSVGLDTLAELRVSPLERARQLEINAERWDKLPAEPGGRYILVNVPDYRLQLVEQGRVTLSMKTVVGKSSKRTPQLSSRITSVVFNPTWTVPRSILLTELLPKARNNPEAMHKRGYRVVNYRNGSTAPISPDGLDRAARGRATLRQVSGPDNALGRVKFVLPNSQAIFLHDTQSHSLFDYRERAFSHGCIRLERPEELAYALLDRQGWDRTRVAQAATGDEMVTVKVEQPPRLYITYITAWVDTQGQIQFRRDIYHRDNYDKPRQ